MDRDDYHGNNNALFFKNLFIRINWHAVHHQTDTDHKEVLSLKQGGGGWVKLVMGIKEGTYCDERWVIYRIAESLYRTPKTNMTLYVNYAGIILKT